MSALMLYEDLRDKLDTLVLSSTKRNQDIFVCWCLLLQWACLHFFLPHGTEILNYSRKISSSPNGLQMLI